MNLKKVMLLSFLSLNFSLISFAQNEQSIDISAFERKPDKFFNINFDQPLRLDSFFWEVFESTSTPAGIVFSYNEDIYEEKYTLQPQSLKLGGILDSFVKVKSAYYWKEENGVINILSKNDYSILDTQISEFKVEKAIPLQLRETLVQTSEFQSYIKERNLIDKVDDGGGLLISGPLGKISERHKVTIDLKNVSVREILNEIVRQRGYSTWSYREYDVISDGKLYKMYRLVL